MKTEKRVQDAMVALIRDRLDRPVDAEWGEARLAFLTHLSHELRTPVTALKLALEGLCEELRDDMTPLQERQAEICLRSVDRIAKLLEERLRQVDAQLDDTDAATCTPHLFLPVD